MMETSLSVDYATRRKKELLLKELEQYGIIFEGDKASKAYEHTLERLLQEAKNKQDTSTSRSQDFFLVDSYESMVRDYISKLTIASVSFFLCNPWAALFWPPYYYYQSSKKHER